MSATTSTVVSANDPPARIAEEFSTLLNRAQELFVGLYDLPTYSSPAVWKPYFQRAFSSFTRLWKFQQLHRVVLEREDVCGLKRHEVGEIASKIGQLYYNYYTRTSETGYLLDAYTFFEAVWDRKYFDKVMDTRLPSVASKRLRFCARFMIVCLLLNRWDRVQVLVVEMKRYVDLFAEVLDPMDKDGWRKTYSDMAALVDALSRSAHGVNLLDRIPPNLRLPILALDASARESASRGLVGEAVICCSWPEQVKFSDFSIDLYRIQQTLERDPVKCNPNDVKDPDCPRKYSLYMPSVSNILAHLSCSLKELQTPQYLLFYFSGPGSASYTSSTTTSTAASPTSSTMPPLSPGPTSVDLMQCGLDMRPVPPGAENNHEDRLHVTDLFAYLRRPFVGIIDSPAAHKVPKIYSAPFMFLMSPQEHPAERKDLDTRRNGSLFTSFLAHPVVALADLCRLGAIDAKAWDAANEVVRQWHAALVETLVKHSDSPKLLMDLVHDDYTQRLIVRFVICRVVLTHHVHFVKTTELPCCHPDLPDVLWIDLEVISRDKLSKVLQVLDVQQQFR
ncbi:protein SCAI [Catenaria anguillulae PL171]|uniref:Protein SCAI n=1 Tax=Catenaria anguillulae PL171 TaxID=765915 RepID=A0A1Y2HBB5_9FUNG|nr:protein SCAI [Catenaria anguillulae PL171]